MRSVAFACVIATVPFLVGRTAAAQAPSAAPADAPEPSAATPAPAQPPPPEPAAPPPAAVDAEAPKVAPVRAFAPAPPEPNRSPLLVVPFLGIHSFQNDNATNIGPGLRLGVLLGGRLSDVVSLGGEAALDVVNPKNLPPGEDVTELNLHVAFSPLLHAKSGPVEIVAGPKLGFFYLSADGSGNGISESASAHGWVYGLNLGLFGALSESVSMGGLVSFDFEKATEVCSSGNGVPEMCTSSGLDNTLKILGVTLALIL